MEAKITEIFRSTVQPKALNENPKYQHKAEGSYGDIHAQGQLFHEAEQTSPKS